MPKTKRPKIKHTDRPSRIGTYYFSYWTYETGAKMPLVQFRSKEEALRLGPLYQAAPKMLEVLEWAEERLEINNIENSEAEPLEAIRLVIRAAKGED